MNKSVMLRLLVGAAVLIVAAVVTFCLLNRQSYQTDPVKLQLNLEKGYWALVRQSGEVVLKEKGYMGSSIKTVTVIEYLFTCKEVAPDGVMTGRQTWERARTSGSGLTGSFEYDSQNPPEIIPPEANKWASLVGRSVDILVKPDGTILEVQGVEVILRASLAGVSMPRDATDEMIEMIKETLTNGIIESRQDLLQAAFRRYPDEELMVGQTWKTEGKGLADRPGNEKLALTYKGIKGGCAHFDLTETLSVGNSMFESPNLIFSGTTLEGIIQGVAQVDLATGLVRFVEAKGPVSLRFGTGMLGMIFGSTKEKILTGHTSATMEILLESH